MTKIVHPARQDKNKLGVFIMDEFRGSSLHHRVRCWNAEIL